MISAPPKPRMTGANPRKPDHQVFCSTGAATRRSLLLNMLRSGSGRRYRRIRYWGNPKSCRWRVSEDLGVRRVNETCLETYSGARMIKNAYGSAIGAFFVVGVFADVFIVSIIPGPYPIDMLLTLVFAPILLAVLGWVFYLCSRNSGDGHVRISRKTGKIYYVIPGEWRLVTLDWQEIQPMVANLHVGGGVAGGTVLNPLFLVGVDWTQSPPREASVSCGNLGWRDSGESARQLLSYIQHFMDFGLEGLPMPDPLPPPMSRKDTFLYGYDSGRRNSGRIFPPPEASAGPCCGHLPRCCG